jgi:hypothetical protein
MLKMPANSKKQKLILSDLEKFAKRIGLKVSSGKLIYAGLKLKSGQCTLRQEPWLIVDKTQPVDDQIELYRQALATLELPSEDIPVGLKEILGKEIQFETMAAEKTAS